MRAVLMSAAALAMAGCALPPQGTGPQDITAFDAAVQSVGCNLIVEGEYLAVELQTGLTREQVVQMIQFKIAAGQAARRPEGGFTFTGGACAA